LRDLKSRIGVFIGLCWLYSSIHLDRQVLAILADSVKSDLGLSDRELGALTGSTFSIVYALLGLHFGRLADRVDRSRLVSAGAWVWSISSIAGALATAYPLLIVSRAGVAAGEAVATAAAVSMMAELAGDRYRARAASVFFACAFLGAGIAAVVGGAIEGSFRHAAIGGWRAAMIGAGIPGILGALYMMSFRRMRVTRVADDSPSPTGRGVTIAVMAASAAAVLAQMRWDPRLSVPLGVAMAALVGAWWVRDLRRRDEAAYRATLGQRPFRWLLAAFAAVLFVDYAAGFWLLPYAQRRFGVSASTAGAQMGALLFLGGIIGCLFGGWVADRWRRHHAAGRVWTALIAVATEAVAIMLALGRPDYAGFIAAFGAFCLASGGWTGVAAAIGLDLVPREHRGTGTAAYFFLTSVAGPGLGPFAVGWGSDRSGSIGTALEWVCVIMAGAALCLGRLGYLIARVPKPELHLRG
jgi:MFS family permease